jgi:dTDP-glucose 4,6-dehydratase|tara:strand:- start:1086 stop:2075 length:990 start_codon:yes stop_codon:yes gene_type:complete
MSTYVVTGGCGFIGSYVIKELLKSKEKNLFIYNIDKMGIGSSKENIVEDKRVENHFMDIANGDAWRLHMANPLDFISKDVNYVIHLAAESHVDRSIDNPLEFVDSNLKGTANVLELVRKHKARMVHVSTDEVYGHLGKDDPPFTEESPLAPRSPYSATKAGSDLLVQSYIETFDIDASVTRCCNNYGPRQGDEKLIPTVIRSIVKGDLIPVYGTGENIREWVHAEDHAKAIIEVLLTGEEQLYNIPGNMVQSNIRLINTIIDKIEFHYPEYKRKREGARMEYIEFVKDRKGHDFKYELSTKYSLHAVNCQQGFFLEDTIKYYVEKYRAS